MDSTSKGFVVAALIILGIFATALYLPYRAEQKGKAAHAESWRQEELREAARLEKSKLEAELTRQKTEALMERFRQDMVLMELQQLKAQQYNRSQR